MTEYVFPPRRILVATDTSEASAAALTYARQLREKHGGIVRVVHAHYFEMPTYFSSGQLQGLGLELQELKRATLRQLHEVARSVLGEETEAILVERPPVEAILEQSVSQDADLVVLGTHGRRGAERLWLGSVAEQILRLSHRPALAVRPEYKPDVMSTILCPVASGPSSRLALRYAAQMARATGASLHAIHAAEPGSPSLDCPLVDDDIRRDCTVQEIRLHGDPASSILEYTRSHPPDIIVMGAARKRSGLGHMFSSTTQKVMHLSPIPLLVVPLSD